MEPFIKVFFDVDRDKKRLITIRDLEGFVRRNDLDPSMVTKWRKLFDPENNGNITLEKFCDVLGLNKDDVLRRETSFRLNRRSPTPIPKSASPKLERSPTLPTPALARRPSPSRVPKQRSPSPTRYLPSDVQVISQSMALERQSEVSEELRRLYQEQMYRKLEGAEPDWSPILQGLQHFLVRQYEGIWQTIAVQGSFWSNYWHAAKNSLIFNQHGYSFLVFRTS